MQTGLAMKLAAMFLALTLALGAEGASHRDPAPARRVAASSTTLRSVDVEEDSTDVPPAGRSGLRALKAAFGAYVSSVISSVSENPDPERIAAALREGLAGQGVVLWPHHGEAPANGRPYGDVASLGVQRPPGEPDLLAVTASFAIPCGSDGVLWLFERRDGRWRLVLTTAAHAYESVSQAKGCFRAAISRDETGRPLVLTGEVSPWCTSNWQNLWVEVQRPGVDPERPLRLLSLERSIYMGSRDEPLSLKLKLARGALRVEFESSRSLDGGRVARPQLIVGRISGDRVELASPVAEDPLGFVDDWVSTPWEIARTWGVDAAAEGPAAWREWHGRLAGKRPVTELEDPLPCPGAKACWIAVLDVFADDHEKPATKLRFTVARRVGERALRRLEAVPVARSQE